MKLFVGLHVIFKIELLKSHEYRKATHLTMQSIVPNPFCHSQMDVDVDVDVLPSFEILAQRFFLE